MATQNEPRLAPPGAGVPLPLKMIMRFYIKPFVAEKADWDLSRIAFERVTEKILKEVQGLNDAQMTRKVLVPPIQGLEDSSRYWSIAMTLEHLAIVGRSFVKVIEGLTHGQTIDGKADTAKVKPLGQLSATESLAEFQKFAMDEYPKMKIGDRNSKLQFEHPWFGPMTARGWHWLYGPHQSLHLKQIREIKKGLQLQ